MPRLLRRLAPLAALTATTAALALASAAPAAPAPDRTLARAGDTTITVSTYRHWMRIAHRETPHRSAKGLRKDVMSFLVVGAWLDGEAAVRGLTPTLRQIDHELLKARHESFKSDAAYRRFLRETGQTAADMRVKMRGDLIMLRLLEADVDLEDFTTRWTTVTGCKAAYTVEGCGATLPPDLS